MSIHIPLPPRAEPVAKAGPIGPGAGPLMTEYTLTATLGRTPQARMATAMSLGVSVPWIRAAERVICGLFSSRDWHLEDENDDTVDDAYPDPTARAAVALIEKPQGAIAVGERLTRTYLWWLTCRHIGLTGNAFWYLDAGNALGLPGAVLYIRPDRMSAITDEKDNLLAWALDRKAGNPGIRLELNEVIHFIFDPPDTGHFGVGLVESALLKAQISQSTDRHVNQVLDAGGRLAGLMSPKSGIIDEGVYQQLVRDARNVAEAPDAAKRMQVLRAPVDFTPTTASPAELGVRDLMTGMRDDLLALWGVPISQLGISVSRGLNSGEATKFDEAALWQNAILPRLRPFKETVQYQLLDRWAAVGSPVELEIDIPEFDDDGPRFELVQRALNLPMRNSERRALIGLDPTGDPAFDDAVWLPLTLAQVAVVPSEPAAVPGPQGPATTPQMVAAMEPAMSGKAELPPVNPFHGSMRALRANFERTIRTPLEANVRLVLDQQKRDIIARVRTRWNHLRTNPQDTSAWWDPNWDSKLRAALAPTLASVASVVTEHVHAVYPKAQGKADPVARILDRGAARVTGINETTRKAIAELLVDAFNGGAELSDVIDEIDALPQFDSYRAELISRTELMDAYNAAAIGAYGDAGLSYVQAIDGDNDAACAARDGQIYSVDDAGTIEDHPNGTLDWVPVIGERTP